MVRTDGPTDGHWTHPLIEMRRIDIARFLVPRFWLCKSVCLFRMMDESRELSLCPNVHLLMRGSWGWVLGVERADWEWNDLTFLWLRMRDQRNTGNES